MKLNTNSNVYTIVYASVMVVIVAFLLAFVSSALKETQDANVANDKRGQILAALNIREVQQVEAKFKEIVLQDLILNTKGDVLAKQGGFEVESKDITAKDDAAKKLPLYVAKVGEDTLYVVPLYGRGLWGGIYGYLALKSDFTTIYGSNYGHEGETAGLGARIVEQEFQEKFIGKQAFSDSTYSTVAVGMAKKIENAGSQVDVITGATLTCNGMDAMFKTSLAPYQPYFSKNRK